MPRNTLQQPVARTLLSMTDKTVGISRFAVFGRYHCEAMSRERSRSCVCRWTPRRAERRLGPILPLFRRVALGVQRPMTGWTATDDHWAAGPGVPAIDTELWAAAAAVNPDTADCPYRLLAGLVPVSRYGSPLSLWHYLPDRGLASPDELTGFKMMKSVHGTIGIFLGHALAIRFSSPYQQS